MNFMFEWQEQYLTSERSERVRYCSCHENIKFISSSCRVMFFLFYRPKKRIYSRINFIANACSSATGISSFSLLSSSLARKSLNNFKSYEVFLFVLTFSCSSEKDFTSVSENLTNLLLALLLAIFDCFHKQP